MTHTPAPPFKHTSGAQDAKIVLVGEAWGKNEEVLGFPFVGWSGMELARILNEVGLVEEPPPSPEPYLNSTMLWYWWKRRTEVMTTNVFAFRPQDNKIETLCGKRADVPKDYPLPPLKQGHYVLPEYLGELERLRQEIEAFPRNLVVALGNTAAWATVQNTKISAIRGAISPGVLCPTVKVLPAYHPANVLYQWQNRVILSTDMAKARHEGRFPEIRYPARKIIVSPTIDEVEDWVNETLASPPAALGVDTETTRGLIDMVGFARSRSDALVVPIFDNQTFDPYWPDVKTEARAWRAVKRLCESDIPKVLQNGLYDIQYFWRAKIALRAFKHDTMLMHHAMYPELPKGLGFLGSVYTNEASWKLMRHREELKRDD